MPRSNTTVALGVLTLTLGGLTACGDGPAPKMVAAKNDGVPVNSAAEERLSGNPKAKPVAATESPAPTPATPAAIESSTPAPTATPVAGAASKAGGSKGGPASKEPTAPSQVGGAKVTKAECKRVFNKYIDLTIGADSRFEGIPPEQIAQMKATAVAQAQSQKGDPCATQEVSRPQYTCAIAATSAAAWTRCMK